jgi:acyl carrier protein
MDKISNFWDSKSPAEREKFIVEVTEKTGTTIGISNAKCRFDKISNAHLRKAIKDATEKAPGSDYTFKSVLKTVKEIITNKFDVDEVDSTDDLINDLGLDSLDYVEMIMEIEHEFDLAISDDTIEALKSHKVSDIVDLTLRHLIKDAEKKEAKTKKLTEKKAEKKASKKSSKKEKKSTKIKATKIEATFSVPEIEKTEEVEETLSVSEELDLCISFDDTGSMYTVRSQVRTNINSLVDRLFDDIPKLRIGIIIHNDYCDMPRHIFVQDFTSDKEKIKKFVNQNSPCGGGDAPECYELALHEASKMSWKSDRRAMVMIGDEVPHHVGYRHGSHTNNLDWKVETEALNAMDVKIYGVQALGRRSSNFFYDGISRMTGGIKLDLSQFQHILTYINAIAYHQSGQLETYRTSDPAFNTNFALKNMFTKLAGGMGTLSAEKIEILSKFQVLSVETDGDMTIKDFVETNGLTFRKGKGYYQLIERTADGKANSEIIQANKEVLFVDKETGETFADTNWCREKLGVPYGIKATVRPLSMPAIMDKYEIFIQSNSYTRKLDPGCKFLYELEAR